MTDADGKVQKIVFVDPSDLGLLAGDPALPKQRPFAVILGCSDARVPIELIFNEGPNDLFVIRVAGNGLGTEVLGSLKYAVDHLSGSLKLIHRDVDRHQFRACCLLAAARIWVQRPCRIASRIRRLPSRDPAGMGTECKQHEGNWIDRCAPRPGRIYRTWQRDIAVRPDYIPPPNLKFHARTFWP